MRKHELWNELDLRLEVLKSGKKIIPKRTFKVYLSGPGSAGKTSLVTRCVEDTYPCSKNSMLLDFRTFSFIDALVPNSGVNKMQIWDTCGKERVRTLPTEYYRGTQGFILCFDITSKYSFRQMKTYFQEKEKHKDKDSFIISVLCGCKCDLEKIRQVKFDEAQDFAFKNGMKYFETSSKSNIKVRKMFFYVMRKLIDRIGKRVDEKKKKTLIDNNEIAGERNAKNLSERRCLVM